VVWDLWVCSEGKTIGAGGVNKQWEDMVSSDW